MPCIARDYADQKELVGNGQCVTLVKKFSNFGRSSGVGAAQRPELYSIVE